MLQKSVIWSLKSPVVGKKKKENLSSPPAKRAAVLKGPVWK